MDDPVYWSKVSAVCVINPWKSVVQSYFLPQLNQNHNKIGRRFKTIFLSLSLIHAIESIITFSHLWLKKKNEVIVEVF